MITRLLFTAIIVSLSLAGYSQTKKKWVHPKPIRDSSWYNIDCDTLYGTIEIAIGQGVLKSEGIVTSCRQYEMTKNIYSVKDQAAIDSFYADQMDKFNKGLSSGVSFFAGGSGFSIGPPMRSAYIKTKDGYKRVEGEFVFKPL
jgi:hypothetical protein